MQEKKKDNFESKNLVDISFEAKFYKFYAFYLKSEYTHKIDKKYYIS